MKRLDELTEYNFKQLDERIRSGVDSIDFEYLEALLGSITNPVLVTGTGGSNAAAYFAALVLKDKLKVITESVEPRDVLYTNLKLYRHLMAVTYGHRNYGIERALMKAKDEGLQTLTLTAGEATEIEDETIQYQHDKEKSFISIAATLTPMAIMLKYHQGDQFDGHSLDQVTREVELELNHAFPLFEVMSGDNTHTAAKILESTIVEAGIGMVVVHDKYNYCHGRSTLSYNVPSTLIYLVNGPYREIDKLLLELLKDQYQNIIILKSENLSKITGEFELAVQALQCCKQIAVEQSRGLSTVNYSPVVKKLYRYKGEL